jgi:hypothetical protein
MTYDEAKEYSFQVPWKVSECFVGQGCWCRIIEPVEPIVFSNDEKYEIVSDGAIDQTMAEYIVKLHNEHLDRTLKDLKKDMDVLNTGLRPLDSITITNTTLKNDYRIICQKEID